MSLVSFQPAATYAEALDRAAELWGIEPQYWDVWGNRHITPAEVRKEILESLGVGTGSKEALDEAVEESYWREWSRLAPLTLVVSQDTQPREFSLRVPLKLARRSLRVQFHWEGGGSERYEFSIEELRDSGRAELRGLHYLQKQAPLPPELPLGYHEVEVSVQAGARNLRRGRMRLIVCPDRTYLPPALSGGGRLAGVAISLYGVRSSRNWGAGDFTDLEGIIDWAREIGASFIALNPLHAIHNHQPYNTSPYLPNSIFYKNLLYLDVERVEDFGNSRRALEIFSRPETQAELEALRSCQYVDYERVHEMKLRFLKLSFLAFLEEFGRDSPRAGRFRGFVRSEGELLDRFATYCALDEWIHRRRPDLWIWPDWPEKFRDPASKAARLFAKKHRRSVLFYKYVQWQVDLQLAGAQQHARQKGLSIGLNHDLALATDRCGSDLWACRAFYVSGCRVGSPPDSFSPNGQDWAFPPPNCQRHRETGYRLFTESIRKNSRHGGALRIDHVMRFFRLFWIPDGMEPAQGAYVRDFHEDLLRILALESVRAKVVVVGEDLGTVPSSVREALQRFGILSHRVFYFEKDWKGDSRPPEEYPEQALVSATTHDLPTLAGFWTCRDIEARNRAGLLAGEAGCQAQLVERAGEKQKILDALFRAGLLPDGFPRSAAAVPQMTGELHRAIIGLLASTPSRLLLLNQEDLTGETEQQNLPGSTWQYPNWRRKMKLSLDELRSDKAARDLTAMLRQCLEKSGRIK